LRRHSGKNKITRAITLEILTFREGITTDVSTSHARGALE